MQVSMKDNQDGTYEVQAHLPRGLRVKMVIGQMADSTPEDAPDVVVNQLLGGGGIRRLCQRAEVVPATN